VQPAKTTTGRTKPPNSPPAGKIQLADALRCAMETENDPAVKKWLAALLADQKWKRRRSARDRASSLTRFSQTRRAGQKSC
jgi:hypothetical protein